MPKQENIVQCDIISVNYEYRSQKFRKKFKIPFLILPLHYCKLKWVFFPFIPLLVFDGFSVVFSCPAV